MRARQCLIYKLWLMGKLWQWRSTLYVFLLAYHKLYFKQHTNIVTLNPLRWHVCFISFWFELWAKLILDSFWHKHFFHHSIEKVLKNTKHVLTYKKNSMTRIWLSSFVFYINKFKNDTWISFLFFYRLLLFLYLLDKP